MSSIVKVDTIQENTSANGITVDGLNIKDGIITSATAITGHTAETSVATDDLILISDTSASGALKKMTRANFVSGIGGANTPAFHAYNSGNQSIANATFQAVSSTCLSATSSAVISTSSPLTFFFIMY